MLSISSHERFMSSPLGMNGVGSNCRVSTKSRIAVFGVFCSSAFCVADFCIDRLWSDIENGSAKDDSRCDAFGFAIAFDFDGRGATLGGNGFDVDFGNACAVVDDCSGDA